MRKSITAVLTAALIIGALVAPSAEAGRKKKVKKRKATASYTLAATGVEGSGFCLNATSCIRFPTKPSERYVKLKVADATGQQVAVSVSHPDSNGDGFSESVGDFCGKSGKLAISGGQELIVFVWAGGNPVGVGGPQCPGIATTGKVKAVFSNR